MTRPILDSEGLRAHLFTLVKGSTLTALSGFCRVAAERFRPITGLARRSQGKVGMLLGLALGSSLSTTGCLVADAPTYGPPQKIPPVVKFDAVVPPPNKQLVKMDSSPQSLDVPFRSEDAGDTLTGVLWLDCCEEPRAKDLARLEFPGSSFDKQRVFRMDWQPDERVAEGCHALSLLLMHAESFDTTTGTNLPKEGAWGDVAVVTWWVNYLPDVPAVAVNCPTSGIAP